jgi:hypothetical protein
MVIYEIREMKEPNANVVSCGAKLNQNDQKNKISPAWITEPITNMSSQPKEEDINAIFDSFRPQIDEHISKWLPRSFTQESMTEMCGPARYAYDLESTTNALLVPIWDILDRGTLTFILAECARRSCAGVFHKLFLNVISRTPMASSRPYLCFFR